MTAVLLFAKAPRPGSVKTRLAEAVGADAAAAAYRAVGARVARQVAARHALTVWYHPPDALNEMRDWLGAHAFEAQQGADLGERMARAMERHFARGDRPVIAIGADAPGVTAATIDAAVVALANADVVVGPAMDGGYYLLGLKRPVPALFRDIPWGASNVLQLTEGRSRADDLRVARLGLLRDLDTAEDLAALGLECP